MSHIPLYRSPYVAIVSAVDHDFLMQWNWSYSKTNGYALRYHREVNRRRPVFMHRVVMERMLGGPIPEGYVVDHRDHNRLNAQRKNLRLITKSENQWWKRVPKNSTTGYKGVTFHESRYEAHIRAHGKRFYLGRFDTAQDAAFMYDAVSAVLHGEFSYPNLPGVAIPDYITERLKVVLANGFGK